MRDLAFRLWLYLDFMRVVLGPRRRCHGCGARVPAWVRDRAIPVWCRDCFIRGRGL